MVAPIADKPVEKDASPARVFEAGVALGKPEEKSGARREAATALLAALLASGRVGDRERAVELAVEWADRLLEKLRS